MSERIDVLTDSYEGDKTTIFFDGPAEFLVKQLAAKLKAVPEFAEVFGESIFGYLRQDFSIRQLPGMRIYNQRFTKEYESWFITGDVKIDVIFPASIRREETQQLQDTLSAAIVQQFRRPGFFSAMEAVVPGLNELGKTVSSDKSLGFEWGEDVVPLTQLTINFRIDLRQWDEYLEATNRTKEQPFKPTLGDLKRIVSVIEGLREDMETELRISSDQTV